MRLPPATRLVVGFEYREDAEQFLVELQERLATFALELKTEKTRLVEFGRNAARTRAARGLGNPETFDFLGFTHACGKTRTGGFHLKRISNAKRVRAKLKQVKAELMRRRHLPIPEQGHWLRSVVQGHLAYYAVPGNLDVVRSFRVQVQRIWYRALGRRSQKKRMDFQRMDRLAARWLPPARVLHPYPERRFDASTRGRNPVR